MKASKSKRRLGQISLRRALEGLYAYIDRLIEDIKKTGLHRLLGFFLAAIAIFGFIVFIIEARSGNALFKNYFDGFWWSVVTMATVGYGDKYPTSVLGRVFGMATIFAAIVFTSLISGSVASIFVERRIREGKGLRELTLKGHVLLLGWNRNAERVIQSLGSGLLKKKQTLVLVNEAEGDWFDGISSAFPNVDLRFVRGDFCQETVLKRASVANAEAVIVIPDESGNNSQDKADERSILATLSVKSLNPDARVSVEILRPDSERHLQRAGVDNLLVSDEFSPFLLSAGSLAKGIPDTARRILSNSKPERLRQVDIPSQLVGKSFLEASGYFIKSGKGILIGVLSQEKQVGLDDLLSNDSSAIDAFIKRKFQEADISLEDEAGTQSDVKLNPGSDYLIRDSDIGFVLG